MKPSTLIVSTLFAAACAAGVGGPASPERAVSPGDGTRVEVALVQPSPARVRMSLTGEVEGARDADLASALGGFVEDVRVRTGDEVRKGDVLVAIDRELYAAGHRQASAQADLAKSEFERLKKMGDAVSPSQLQQAETQHRVADAGLAQAAVRLRRASIVAPFDGVVSRVGVDTGEVVGPASPLLRLVQLDPAVVVLSVSDRDVVALEPGVGVVVTAGAVGGRFDGTIARVSPVGDGKTRAFAVEVEVGNPDRQLLPGMVARVQIERELGEAVVVPSDWIISTADEHGVFVAQDGVARWRTVTLGRVLQNQVVVASGIEPGDAVVMVGHRELIDGDPILVSRSGRCCVDGRVDYDAAGGR
jgi:membrane fusion protein (multidrug efflux system)